MSGVGIAVGGVCLGIMLCAAVCRLRAARDTRKYERRVQQPDVLQWARRFNAAGKRKEAPPPAAAAAEYEAFATMTGAYRVYARADAFARDTRTAATLGDGVVLGASAVPGGGAGLFATRAFGAGEIVTLYEATRVLSAAEARAEVAARGAAAASHMRTLQPMVSTLDGVRSAEARAGMGGGSLANDAHGTRHALNARFLVMVASAAVHARYFAFNPYGREPNPVLRDVAGPVRVALEATRDIAVGDEVYVSYGHDYWARR